MSEEKITNEEILTDEELNEVAGGTSAEIQDDANKLRSIGRRYGIELLPNDKLVSTNEVNAAFNRMGDLISHYFHCDFSLGCDLREKSDNKYYLNHKKMSRSEIWNKIYAKLDSGY